MPSPILNQLGTFGPHHCERLSYERAAAYTRSLVRSQYENFTVVSRLLPRRLREDFVHIYAFCRWADDLGDETGDARRSLELLQWWRDELRACYADQPRHPVFIALHPTIRRHDIPIQPFEHLIDAFEQDQRIDRYRSWEQALDYCTRSANPVGRLVLYTCGYRDARRQTLSDRTCTALQLANFWQDVRRDILERDRIYVPSQSLAEQGLSHEHLIRTVRCERALSPEQQAGYRRAIRALADRTQILFSEGRGLWPLVSPDVRLSIKLFTLGGERVLNMIRRIDYDTLHHRPTLSKMDKLMLMGRAAAGKLKRAATVREGLPHEKRLRP